MGGQRLGGPQGAGGHQERADSLRCARQLTRSCMSGLRRSAMCAAVGADAVLLRQRNGTPRKLIPLHFGYHSRTDADAAVHAQGLHGMRRGLRRPIMTPRRWSWSSSGRPTSESISPTCTLWPGEGRRPACMGAAQSHDVVVCSGYSARARAGCLSNHLHLLCGPFLAPAPAGGRVPRRMGRSGRRSGASGTLRWALCPSMLTSGARRAPTCGMRSGVSGSKLQLRRQHACGTPCLGTHGPPPPLKAAMHAPAPKLLCSNRLPSRNLSLAHAGEDYDGRGACTKWTDKWAERELPGGAREQWGDKWTEQFGSGKGEKHGEVWSVGAGESIMPGSTLCGHAPAVLVRGCEHGRSRGRECPRAWWKPNKGLCFALLHGPQANT